MEFPLNNLTVAPRASKQARALQHHGHCEANRAVTNYTGDRGRGGAGGRISAKPSDDISSVN